MKKEHIYFFLVFATFIVSFVSLGISLPRCDWDNGMDYLGVIVAILAVLVTVLIGLQLYNYIFARENIKQIVDGEIQKMVKDYELVTQAHDNILEGYEFVVSDYCNEKIVNAIMSALQCLTKCDNINMKNSCLDYVMNESHRFIVVYSSDNGLRIYKGKRDEYLFVLSKIDHKYVAELRRYVEIAAEVEQPHRKIDEGKNN